MLILNIDLLISAVRYFILSPVSCSITTTFPRKSIPPAGSIFDGHNQLINWRQVQSFHIFLNPPDPTPAAILLPPSEKPMNHIRPSTGDSFFAPPRTTIRPETILHHPHEPAHDADLDPETRRWLVAYPTDPELVPLIGSMRQGRENDDFILSDVGLLYLRPDGDEPALLVPPAGTIRDELIADAHVDPGGEGEGGHVSYEEMMTQLGGVFWWMTMESDVMAFVEGCKACEEVKLKPGMTPVPFTGVTGWASELGEKTAAGPGESAMAADMAFAMRAAKEDAEKDALG